MSGKRIIFGTEAREKIRRGVDTLADAVKVTLGPLGRNVAFEKPFGSPVITKDGVTVAKEIKTMLYFPKFFQPVSSKIKGKNEKGEDFEIKVSDLLKTLNDTKNKLDNLEKRLYSVTKFGGFAIDGQIILGTSAKRARYFVGR